MSLSPSLPPGVLNTYWLTLSGRQSSVVSDSASAATNVTDVFCEEHENREELIKREGLISWVAERLSDYLKQVIGQRQLQKGHHKKVSLNDFVYEKVGSNMDEVVEVIALPNFRGTTAQDYKHQKIEIDPVVQQQLRNYVSLIASCYRNNPFHNFEV